MLNFANETQAVITPLYQYLTRWARWTEFRWDGPIEESGPPIDPDVPLTVCQNLIPQIRIDVDTAFSLTLARRHMTELSK